MDICQQLIGFCRKFPLMRVEDYVKLLFQSEFFGGHFVISEDDALNRLKAEVSNCVVVKTAEESDADDFCNMSRVNLRPFARKEKNIDTLNHLFVNSSVLSNGLNGREDRLIKKFDIFLELVKNKKIDLPYLSAKRYVKDYCEKGFPLLSHSSAVKMNYFPAYRVVRRDFWFLFDVIDTIDFLLDTNLTVTVAIDGNSGAGKSFFAKALGEYYGANVLSADDFFLPANMRTEERLSQIGGNIHYERLRKTLLNMKDGNAFEYQKYDCHNDAFVTKYAVPSRVNVVEGCYSLHPSLCDCYNLGVVLSVSKNLQLNRIINRDGLAVAEKYRSMWIPLENKFLDSLFDIDKKLRVIKLPTDNFDFEAIRMP